MNFTLFNTVLVKVHFILNIKSIFLSVVFLFELKHESFNSGKLLYRIKNSRGFKV
jgi:hypothetical protein